MVCDNPCHGFSKSRAVGRLGFDPGERPFVKKTAGGLFSCNGNWQHADPRTDSCRLEMQHGSGRRCSVMGLLFSVTTNCVAVYDFLISHLPPG